ncbi:MAG: chorismate mutase [Lachnospiraceae bacterium]|nr:chorismate mutase [Lachnospiraceae bacterium]
MKDLLQCREEIDCIDKQITALFEERMQISADVAAYKKHRERKYLISKEKMKSWRQWKKWHPTGISAGASGNCFHRLCR